MPAKPLNNAGLPAVQQQALAIAACDKQPLTKHELGAAIGLTADKAGRIATRLGATYRLVLIRHHGGRLCAKWASPRLADELFKTAAGTHGKAAESVHIAQHREWLQPAPPSVTTAIINGQPVKITVCHTPPERFAANLRPGTGVISADNPGLARLAKRRAARGQHQPQA